jgi:glycosyltransferase involved in cell wall biosynthesis
VKISIITAVYNNKSLIAECIESVLSQSYKNIEHIIIDGGSTDGTKEIILKYQSKIANFVCEPDNGMYDAINKGISKATGEVIGLLHSDDLFADITIISQIAETFLKTSADGVYGNLLYVDRSNISKIIRNWKSSPFLRNKLNQGWMPPHPTLFLKKVVADKIGFFNTNYKIAADYDFMLRTLKTPGLKFEYIPSVITCMRVGGASNRNFKNIIRKSWEDYLILKRNKVGGFLTLLLKNFSKLGQFLTKEK